jgi:predicted ABC-type ATPase
LLKSGKVEGMPEEGGKTHVMINSDEIKTGENGKTAIPEFRERVMGTDKAAGEGAAHFVHEESAFIAKRVQAAAIERRQSVLLDGTGDSSAAKLGGKVGEAKAAGYKVRGVYVTIPTEAAVSRVRTRGSKPVFEGANFGRVVPDSVTRDIHVSVSRVLPAVASTGLFDSLEVWDNTNSPVLIFSSAKGGVQRNGLWKGFVAKGFEKLSTEKP